MTPSRPAELGAWLAGTLVLALTFGCKPHYSASESVGMATDACCKLGNEKMTKFAGCRLASRCRTNEPLWLNGAVTCGPVEETRCHGGRCCEFRPRYGTADAPLTWNENEGAATAAEAAAPTPAADAEAPAAVAEDPAS